MKELLTEINPVHSRMLDPMATLWEKLTRRQQREWWESSPEEAEKGAREKRSRIT